MTIGEQNLFCLPHIVLILLREFLIACFLMDLIDSSFEILFRIMATVRRDSILVKLGVEI